MTVLRPLFTFVILAALIFGDSQAAPVHPQRRSGIDQIISQSTQPWKQACQKAGGSMDTCSNVAVTAFTSLLEAGGVCDQQNSADTMIDLAKQLGNDPDMIRLTQIFVQQPRNAPDGLQVPYCQVPPKNSELNGLFHCQFAGSDFTKFSGDQTGNIPLGVTSLNPPGSCPASPNAPVPDGVQLNALVQIPIAQSSASPIAEPTGTANPNAVPTTIAAVPDSSANVTITSSASNASGASCNLPA